MKKSDFFIKILKYASIDIGSNAVRLLLCDIVRREGIDKVKFKKTAFFRVPIRSGSDVFSVGEISEKNIIRLVDTMKAFQLLMEVYAIEVYRAYATSAFRESSNGAYVVDRILEKTGVKIEIIDGKKEAEVINLVGLNEVLNNDEKFYLYVDVGGGSTEITLHKKDVVIVSESFKIGTVRMLNNKNEDLIQVWNLMSDWVKKHTKDIKHIGLIGSGGNINKIYRLSQRNDGSPLSFVYMKNYYKYLKSLTYEERIYRLNLNEDRSDVIIPAMKVYLSIMKWSKAKNIYIPRKGLSDGIIRSMYNNRYSTDSSS